MDQTQTTLYLEQLHLVAAGLEGTSAQIRIFASIDLAVNGQSTHLTKVARTAKMVRSPPSCAGGGHLTAWPQPGSRSQI